MKRKKLFPLFVYCTACRTCRHRRFKNLFDDKSMLDCADCNGLTVQTIIPFVLWRVSWCKLYSKKKENTSILITALSLNSQSKLNVVMDLIAIKDA